MILSELNYLEPVSENKVIVGGMLTSTWTDSTYSHAVADAGPNGIVVEAYAAAVSGAIGDYTSAFALTNTNTDTNNIFTFANAMANAASMSLGPEGYDASNSLASSLYILSPQGETSLDFASSSSI